MTTETENKKNVLIKKCINYFLEFDEKELIRWVLGVSFIILIYFFTTLKNAGYWIWGGVADYQVTAQVGDFIGGLIGTVFSAAGFYLVYVTLREQRKSFERERFETRFFEMLKVYKENVSELNYTEKHRVKGIKEIKNRYEGRKVFKSIHYDFTLLYSELASFFKNVDEIYKSEYKDNLLNNPTIKDRNIDLLEFARLDITYCIIFFGLSSHDRKALINTFSQRYDHEFIKKIIVFAALKPKEESFYYAKWNSLGKEEYKDKIEVFTEQYRELNNHSLDLISKIGHNNLAKKIYKSDKDAEDIKYDKYYGGHQFRLGHYYRHLFLSINYVNKNTNLSYLMKYENIKLLRAQISTFEQKLIFLNSVSSLGRSWELERIGTTSEGIKLNDQLITKYNLLKNIPDDELFANIKVTNYYPLVILETNYNPIDILKRQKLEKQYI